MIVSEVFRSIQGEGKMQGYPCTFLRLAGCNLSCAWCDTVSAREGGTPLPGDEVMHRVTALPGSLICITGGEPLLQGDELLPLVRTLHESGYTIMIETNGTIDFREYQPYASICMDVKCPCSGEESNLALLQHIFENDSVKFVVADQGDCQYAEVVLEAHPVRGEVFFSPVHGTDYGMVAAFLLERNLPVRLQLQLHRIIGVR